MKKIILIGLAVVLLVGLLALVYKKSEPKKKTIEVGFQGLARVNDFLALHRFMQGLGYSVKSKAVLPSKVNELDSSSQLFVGGSIESFSEAKQTKLFHWVTAGGFLIVGLNVEEWVDLGFFKFGDKNSKSKQVKLKRKIPLFDWLDVKLIRTSQTGSAERVLKGLGSTGAGEFKVHINNAYRFRFSDSNTSLRLSDSLGEVAAIVRLGEGRVLIVNDLSMFDNHNFALHDHAALFSSLINQSGNKIRSEVLMIYRKDVNSFFSIFYQNFSYFILSFLALVVAWFWKSIPRFGRVKPIGSGGRRSLQEHITASAYYLWTSTDRKKIAESVRDSTLKKLQAKRYIERDWSEGVILHRIVSHCEQSESAVKRFLQPNDELSAQDLVKIVNTSIEIGNRL